MRRNFKHFDEEIIILNIMNVSTMNEKLTFTPLTKTQHLLRGSESFRSFVVWCQKITFQVK